MLFPGLFDTEHYFIIDPIDENRCRFVQGEEVGGLFGIPILWLIGGATLRGFERMNEALKSRCEELLHPRAESESMPADADPVEEASSD